VRIRSLLRKAEEVEAVPGPVIAPANDAERNLMLQLVRLPEVIERTVEHRAPNHLAEYAYELVADFSRFYEACHVLSETDLRRQGSWLRLVELTLAELELLLDLLVIEIPDRM
jgi:arginyl-tRNA synthetase